ncbi:RNA 2',3'-cyclic phosphodiesterase [Caenispirillum bisanense]|uniref:RNA 2',3'-cyclic phosphodiesterase n=1 Tax=Caenispirillum bisanense TaxID=414052 RepID=A0A286GTW6_9PROT|nr:RNA 2',3'-cyclic phosphodiesterase [Caenispirillum bisanense]SOD99003.1 2'-5' RNA ligase [Caenispirillum bisanense]
MIRLFVGLDLPADLRDALDLLTGGIPGAHWRPAENYHVTLRFIGEVDEDRCEDIHDALAEVRAPAFDLCVAGIGAFDNGQRAHTLWAGVPKDPPLVHLRDKVERAVVSTGLPPERRKFAPHVTLASVKQAPVHKVQDFIAHHNLFRSEPFRVDRFTLFSSDLGRGGPTYTAEADYPLTEAG